MSDGKSVILTQSTGPSSSKVEVLGPVHPPGTGLESVFTRGERSSFVYLKVVVETERNDERIYEEREVQTVGVAWDTHKSGRTEPLS